MKNVFVAILCFFIVAAPVAAVSQQAYQDYLYQFNVYRKNYDDFVVAKNSYATYKTLESQTQAVAAAKTMLSQRDLLLHTYLLYLYERAESQSQSRLAPELAFLERDRATMASVTTLADATAASATLENHYLALSITVDQTIAAISLSRLAAIDQNIDRAVNRAQNEAAAKHVSTGSWMAQITQSRAATAQTMTEVARAVTLLSESADITDLAQKFADVTTRMGDAKKGLVQTAGYLTEVARQLATN